MQINIADTFNVTACTDTPHWDSEDGQNHGTVMLWFGNSKVASWDVVGIDETDTGLVNDLVAEKFAALLRLVDED